MSAAPRRTWRSRSRASAYDAAMASIVPPNALGAAAVGELRRHGVDTEPRSSRCRGAWACTFTTPGAVMRPVEVLYDRAGSAFALAAPDAIEWPRALRGARWLHVSGIASALGERAAAANQRAADAAAAARRRRVVRRQLPRAALGRLGRRCAANLARHARHARSIAFVDDRDIGPDLGARFAAADAVERRRAAAPPRSRRFRRSSRSARRSRTPRSAHGSRARAA